MAEKKLPSLVIGMPGAALTSYDSRLIRVVVAVAVAVIAIVLGRAVGPVFGAQAPWTLFVLAVAVSAWFGGLKPGLLTAAPLLVMGYYLDQSPGGAEGVATTTGTSPVLSTLLFGFTSLVICAAMQR